jgi:hypothetical protein
MEVFENEKIKNYFIKCIINHTFNNYENKTIIDYNVYKFPMQLMHPILEKCIKE